MNNLPQPTPNHPLALHQNLPMTTPNSKPITDILNTLPSEQLIDAVSVLFAEWKVWFKGKMQTTGDRADDWGIHTIDIWAKYLTACQMTYAEFVEAKNKVMTTLTYPPDNAKVFLDLVRGDQTFSYPDSRTAYLSACSPDYNPHEHLVVVHETVRRIGEYALKNHPEYQTYPIWKDVYKRVCEEHEQGKVFHYPLVIDIASVSKSPFAGMLEQWRANQTNQHNTSSHNP